MTIWAKNFFSRSHVIPENYISSDNDGAGNTHSHTSNHSIDYELNSFEELQKWRSKIIRPVVEYIPSSPILTIYDICTLLDIPEKVAKLSLLIYQEFKSRSGVEDRSTIALVVATIYLVCRRLSLPYNIEEILQKAVGQRLNNKTACMVYNYCKVLLIQNVLDHVISNHAIYSFQVGEQNKSWQYKLLHDIEENLLKLRALRNKSASYLVPKPSYILRIHAKGKKQITGELRGKSKEELCAIGVIADYYRKANYFDRKRYMTVPSYKKLKQDPL
jgi:Transcription factor TFIIB repeat